MSKQNPSSPLRLVRSSDEGFLPFSGANVLSAEQQAAVAHRGSPLIITGATGTGKTTVVIESALARITAGQSPDSILIIAYGRERASEIRDAIVTRSAKTAHEPLARTFHSLAYSILKMRTAENVREIIYYRAPNKRLLSRSY